MSFRTRSIRKALIVTAAAVMLLVSTGVMSVLAVHDETFQLDGDASASTTTNYGNKTQTLDWDSLFDASGAEKTLPSDFTASGFQRDFLSSGSAFVTSDTTTFATGSKDTLPISGWQCNFDNNVNSKIDVMNAYAAAYTNPVTKDQIIYFALERNTNTGDANVAFWFLQSAVGCSTTGAAQTFTGHHTDGDVLIVSEFSNGGTVSTINVYRWNGDDTGSLGQTPIAQGVDCRSGTLGTNDPACAAANTAGISTPWLTSNFKDKVGHSLRTAEFFEGGVNLTDTGLGGRCFNTFIGDTRSSTSLTATLFDYAAGQIGECTSDTVTTPSISSATIPADPNDASISVTDSATVTVSGISTWSADVSWHLCGPTDPASTALCETGGVPIGNSKTASDSTPTVVSDAAIVTSAGRYCWRADFAGDTTIGLPASSDSRSSECFIVSPRQPTLATQAGAGPVDFGQPVTDTATLGNTAHEPGTGGPAGSNGTINPTTLGGDAQGTITFTLYKNDCSTLATGTGKNPQTLPVSGDGSYGPVSFTPNAPGTYHWVASYDGDSPNTLSATHNTACNDTNEDVVVRQIPTEIKTKQSWIPNDTATISSTVGNLAAGGTVDFALYSNATCSGTALYTEQKTLTGGNPSEEVGTSNTTTFKITSAYTDPADSTKGAFSWKVVYTPAAADTAHTGIQSSCDAEHFTITYTNDPGPGSNLP